MTRTTITPSSTTPITSADAVVTRFVSVGLALLAVIVGVGAGRLVIAGVSGETGLRAFNEAVALAPSAARDDALNAAQRSLTEALEVTPADARLWLALAETRYLQATGGAAGIVSPELGQAAADAAARALALVPTDGVAAARVAQGLGLAGAAADQVASALSASYRLEPEHPSLKAWRPAVAFTVWGTLEPATQAAAVTEACLYGREGAEPYAALVAAANTATDQALRTQLSALVKDGACRALPVVGTPASRS